jgi:eukaryotic-like serine/threonine-protein kinase
MEYVDGLPLAEYCRSRALPVTDRLRLFRSACDAVRHAHDRAIIHRDLKPSNILVTADGTPKLLDFGIAKQLDALDSPAAHTRTAFRLMTPAYAAPEQVRGEPLGTFTDIYALGVVLYELLAGRLPFDLSTATPAEAERIILEREPDRPSVAAARAGAGIGRAAWADLDVLCATAMHRDPERRYRTVDALVRDIDHFLAGEPLDARPDGVAYRAGKFLRRHRRAVGAFAAASLALVTVSAGYTVRLVDARDAAASEAARGDRIQRFMLSLFEGGDEAAGPADTLRVVALLERGVREASALDTEPAVRAELFQTLGGLYQSLGDHARADSLLGDALAERRRLFDDGHPDVARALLAMGELRAAQARSDEAETLIREALAISQTRLPPDHPESARARTALGFVLQQRGDYDGATLELEAALRAQRGRTPDAGIAATLTQLANTRFYAGDYTAADSLNRQLLDINRALYGEGHPHVADNLINLGAVRFQQGAYDEAETHYRGGVAIMESFYGADHPRWAASASMLARALVAQGRFDEAIATLEPALAVRERVHGPDHPAVAAVLNEIGTVALRNGDLAGAADRYIRTAGIWEGAYGRDHYLVGIARSNLASVRYEEGAYAAAESLLREGVDIFTAALGETHVETAIGRIKLARPLVRLDRFEEAERALLNGIAALVAAGATSSPWVERAREDLVAAYEAMGRSADAERYRVADDEAQ